MSIFKSVQARFMTASAFLLLAGAAQAAQLGSRQQTILPLAVPPETPAIAPSNVSQYLTTPYGTWTLGTGTNEGQNLALMPAGYAGATHAARLLAFFTMSDIHVTDKESPAQVPYVGWRAAFQESGPGGLNQSAYSPAMLYSTFRLDAAVRTVNDLHRLAPFDFGMVLGDICNSSQYNELRWFIDVMDGQYIVPSSGAHVGAETIDYQMPFQAAGLDRSIPWYVAIGNHDQYWMGIGLPTPKIQQALIGSNVLEISTNGPLYPNGSEGTGMYGGTVDGSTPFGDVIDWGPTNLYATPPSIAADTNRHTITQDNASPTNFVREFFNTSTLPQGHGFNLAETNAGSLAACYVFAPLTNVPIKMIVLDDTCKTNKPGQLPTYYGGGWVDAARYAWLTNELQKGQDADQLMIVACHVPINPQANLFDTNQAPGRSFYLDPGNETETNLIATLQRYPNLLMVMAGHRHLNVVTPFPSPDPEHPENGFWEVETPSLRDFPMQFRTLEILRNDDNSISILTTCVDPVAESNSPTWKSIGYAVGACRLFGLTPLDDTSSHAFNVELVKPLTPAMQAAIAACGEPLGRKVAIDQAGPNAEIHFLGDLQATTDVENGPWDVVAQDSPYIADETNRAAFYRSAE